jgi:hypothetical protein
VQYYVTNMAYMCNILLLEGYIMHKAQYTA